MQSNTPQYMRACPERRDIGLAHWFGAEGLCHWSIFK